MASSRVHSSTLTFLQACTTAADSRLVIIVKQLYNINGVTEILQIGVACSTRGCSQHMMHASGGSDIAQHVRRVQLAYGAVLSHLLLAWLQNDSH